MSNIAIRTDRLGNISEGPNFRTRLKDAYYMAGVEIYHSNPANIAILGAAAIGLAFEWGPGNEALIGSIGASTYEATNSADSISSFITSNAITGLTSGAASATEQFIVGTTTALALNRFPSTISMLYRGEKTKTENNNSIKGSVASTLALGTSALVLFRNLKEKERSIKKDVALVGTGSLVVGGFNFGLISLVSTAVRTMEKLGLSEQTDTVIKIAKQPLSYIGLFGIYKTLNVIKEKIEEKRSKHKFA